jgi:tRNA pseudouridine32 synthase/23S rRNA pseudouridine746 synthase
MHKIFSLPVYEEVIISCMLHILFQDDNIIAIDKPSGLACIAERDRKKDNLHSQLSALYPHKIYIIHRLDKETSGVVLFAKNADTHRSLCRQFAEHTVRKTYLALLHGSVAGDSGTIDKPIRQFGSGRVAIDMERGKPSVTKYEVIERFNEFTLVHAYPVTGHRHQLRVHFYSIGYAIVGDPLYGNKNPRINSGAKYFVSRLMLHAEKTSFSLPSGKQMTIEAPLPESLIQTIESLRKLT